MKTCVPFPLREGGSRYSLLPIRNPGAWEMYKKAQASTWTTEEIDLGCDDFDTLNKDERQFIENILAFFAFGDGMVNENIVYNMLASVEQTELRYFYSFQLAIENVHGETYALLIDKYITDPERKACLNNAVSKVPCMRKKAAWIESWISCNRTFAERLVAFACVEGIFFSGAFCAIFWMKKRAHHIKLPGLFFSNEVISRDESLHCEFACYVHSMLCSPGTDMQPYFDEHGLRDPEEQTAAARASMKASPERILEIVVSAVGIEHEFVERAMPVSLIGMNADLMKDYVCFVADRLLVSLGAPAHFNKRNPFDWMDAISLEGKTNFFERRVSEYQKAGVLQPQTTFATNEDF